MNARPPDIPPPVSPTRKPEVRFPAGATDCHAHVFGPQERYPLLPATHFVPHVTDWPRYRDMLASIGCERAVLVQPSVYGTDNAAIEAALAQSGMEMRAVAVVSPDITDRELERLHGLGFRGIRINTASWTQGLKLTDARKLAERIRHLGWHLQFYANFREQPEVEEILAALPVPIVIDHFGRIRASEGTAAPAFQAVLRLLRRDNCHAKLIGPYFISDQFPHYHDITPFARAMVEVAPNRVVWGTDWPHASARDKMQDDGDLADMLAEWVPDEKMRHKVLVANPARLYGFPGA
jgi:predicted TIM-barrel fold metal-dependent hydrolase